MNKQSSGGWTPRRSAYMMRRPKYMKTQDLIDLANSPNLDRKTFESILFSERPQGIKVLADREDIPIEWCFEAIEHNFGPNYSSSKKLKLIDEL